MNNGLSIKQCIASANTLRFLLATLVFVTETKYICVI